MVSAVVMAGYSHKEIEDYKRQLEKGYDEEFIKCYKPLANIAGKPIILFTLETLSNIGAIDDIVIVGEKHLLEERLNDWIYSQKKEVKVLDQSQELSQQFAGEFDFNPSLVHHDSLCGNALKAYTETKAYQNKEYALFIASDSPLTTKECIETFLENAKKHIPESSMIYPFTSMEEKPIWRKAFHRKYAFLINDTEYQYPNRCTTWFTHREGFRASSFVLADPSRIDSNVINSFYGMRKVLSSEVRERISHFLEQYDLAYLIKRYFKGKLKVTDCEKAISKILCRNGSTCTIMPISDEKSTYDFDGTRKDLAILRGMIKND